jgi:hypothetical protein
MTRRLKADSPKWQRKKLKFFLHMHPCEASDYVRWLLDGAYKPIPEEGDALDKQNVAAFHLTPREGELLINEAEVKTLLARWSSDAFCPALRKPSPSASCRSWRAVAIWCGARHLKTATGIRFQPHLMPCKKK